MHKCLAAFVVVPTGTGSFDYVRLTPHFAQDDRVWGEFRMTGCAGTVKKRRTKDHH
jgi:hypothetical protein